MKYIVYYRVSSKDQDLGIPAQKTMINNYLNEGDEVICEYSEKETGTNKKVRLQLLKAIQHTQETGAILLIAKLDRLARNVRFISTLMETGVKFKALDLPEADPFTIHIFAALAEKEAKLISQRTKAALGELKNQGVKLGNLDNLTDEGRMKGVETIKAKAKNNPNTRPARAYAELLHNQGNNYSQIAEKLNENHFKSPRGGIYYPHTAKRLLN